MLAIDEEYAPAWLFQGSWLLKTERPDDALIAFERATNLEPGPSADFGRAQALIAAGRHAEAIEILEPLSKKSMHPQVHRTLGEALRSVGRTQEARRALAKGQDAAPLTWPDTRLKERDAHIRGHASYQLAQRLSASGKVDDALKILERLQGYHPPEKCGQEEEFFLACNLMNSLTIAYDRTGRPSRALETDIDWVVYAKRPFAGPAAVLEYLSRYTHRVAISNARLISHDTHGVTFKYKDYRDKGRYRQKTMTLTSDEFIWRFLIHVLPHGFHRIRHYGLLANANRRDNLIQARQLLLVPEPIDQPYDVPATYVCRSCDAPMVIIESLAPRHRARSPPGRIAA